MRRVLVRFGIACLTITALVGCPARKQPSQQQPPPQTEQPVETGFVVGKDSFAFSNFTGASADAVLGPTDLVRMFGAEAVCANPSEAMCRPKKVAEAWLAPVNDAMSGGRCEGFSILSGLLFEGVVDRSKFGSGDVQAIAFDTAIKHEMAYWSATQYLAVARTSTKALNAADAVAFLKAEYAKQPADRDLWRIGFVRLDDQGRPRGGHSVLAIGVAPVTGEQDKYAIKVYDSNHPQETDRSILIDTKANTWQYQGDTLYQGDLTRNNPLYLSPSRPRDGQQPCPFCRTSGEESAALTQVLSSAGVDTAATDDAGNTTGVQNGLWVNKLEDGYIAPTFSDDGLQWEAEPISGQNWNVGVTYNVVGRGGHTGAGGFSAWGNGTAAVVRNDDLSAGQTSQTTVGPKGPRSRTSRRRAPTPPSRCCRRSPTAAS